MSWLNQTLGNAHNFLKQTAGKVSDGIKWLHQNIVEPGVKIGKQFGGDIGKFAEGVGQASSAVNDVNEGLRNKTLKGSDLKRGYNNLREGVDKARSSSGGAVREIKSKIGGKRMKMY